MAGTMKNMKALLSDSRSRTILLFLGFVVVVVLVIAAISIRSRIQGPEGASSIVGGAGNIESVPFATNPTEQYTKLIEEQNIQKASTASKTGGSAIPTITQAKEFGAGESIGPTEGQGGVGFSTLKTSDMYGGVQKDLWLKTLKDGNCSQAAVQSVVSQGATLQNVREVCSCAQLKSDGYTPEQLKPVCNCEELRSAGFSALQMKNAGYSAPQLRVCGYDACQMRAAGFSAAELLAAGYTEGELKGAGFTDAEIRGASGLPTGITEDDVRKAGCSPDALARLKASGVSASVIRRISGCTAAQMKAGGYTAAELKAAGFSAAELKAAGFSDADLKGAGFSDKEIAAANEALKKENCSVENLKKMRAAGVTATQIRQTLGCSAAAMKAAGFTAKELRDAGYTAAELKAAGFSAKELKDAGFSAAELKAAGFSAKELKDAGFTAAELKAAGFSAAELKAAGFTAAELKAAGFSAKELKDAGFTAAELKAAGFTAAELRAAGFSAAELRAAGFSAKDLANAGFSADEIRAAGYNEADLRLAGLSTAVDVTGAPGFPGQAGGGTDSSRQLEQVLQAQALRISEQRLQQKIQTRTAQLGSQMSQVVNEWQPVEQFYTAAKEVDEKKEGMRGEVDATSAEALKAQQKARDEYGSDKVTIKAGEVMFAVMDTSVNSDEEGPVLATIVSGPLKGSRVIGTFTPPPAGGNQQKIVLTFNIINVPGIEKSTSINAVAIDPQTARTALASHVDNHYLLRYGSLFASSFMEGIGSAYQQQGTSITAGGVPGANGGVTGASQNTTTISQSDRTLTENAIAGLAKVGQRWGNQVAPLFNRPPTIQIYSGTSLGLLIQSDFTYAKSKPTF